MALEDLFARIPKGKNSIKDTFTLYNEKKFYYDHVYPSDGLPWLEKPFDFVNENPLYGKVNLNGDYIIPKYTMINNEPYHQRVIEVNDESSGVTTFDFVAAAFNDLRKNIKLLVKSKQLSAEGPIAKFEAKRGFVDFETINKLQKEIHYFAFVSQFLNNNYAGDNDFKYKEILNTVSDFVSFFLLYLKTNAKIMPFTKSGTMNAFYMVPMSTGLCLEIGDGQYDDDQKKHDFLTDPNFNIYRIAARRFGFMIDRNVPWRLVADVQSFKMREYMRLAYEEKIIAEKQRTILQAKANDVRGGFPDIPNIEDMFELAAMPNFVTVMINGIPTLAPNKQPPEWQQKSISKGLNWNEIGLIRTETEKELSEVYEIVSTETIDFWTIEEMHGAKDPLRGEDGKPLCAPSLNEFKTCKSRIFKLDKFFEVYYDVPYLSELADIKQTFYKYFLSYYVQNPTTRKKIICSDAESLEKKFIVEEVDMVLVSEEQYNELYSSPHWLKMYFDIKLAENNIKIKPVVYNKHLKHIIALSTLNLGADSPGGGVTSKNAGHAHEYDSNAEWTDYAIHPENPNVKHRHKINNGVIQPAQSECFPDCVEGVAMHAHEINNDIFFAIRYINEVVRKQMKGLKQSYDKKGKEKEGLIGQMLNGASQSGMIGDY